MATLERMRMDMREVMVIEDLEDVIWRFREFLNCYRPQPSCFKFTFHEKEESSDNINLVKTKMCMM